MKYKRKKNYWQRDITKIEYTKAFLIGISLIGVVSYLFYGTFYGAILLSPYLIRYFKSWETQIIKKKKQQFHQQFKEAIQSLSTALNVGYSVENAMRETAKDLQVIYKKDEKIVREFHYMTRQLEMNIPIETVLAEFSQRVNTEDVHLFITVFSIAKRSGGDMLRIIREASNQISGKIEIKNEIEAMMAAKRLEFQIMSVIPIVMICYLKMSFPEFMEQLYGNLLGVCVMSLCLIVYLAAYELGKHIIEIEV